MHMSTVSTRANVIALKHVENATLVTSKLQSKTVSKYFIWVVR